MRFVWLLALLLASAGCATGGALGERRELVVFAAASLTDAFAEAADAFEASQHDVRVSLNFAGTSLLRIQLEYGASADLFASADRQQMTLAQSEGLIKGEPQVFATSELVLISRMGGPVQELRDLARPGVRLVVALPEVPAGAYAEQLLGLLSASPEYGPDFVQAVRGNIASLESNVRLVVSKVLLGEADAGFVYATDADGEGDVLVAPLAESYLVKVEYLIATTRDARSSELSEEFTKFLTSEEGQAVLGRHGFGGPPG